MHILEFLVNRLAAAFKVPESAIGMFRTANELSGLDRKTIPTELIPLNTIQLARGLLNFTVLQSLDGWVLPYWAERQYDPSCHSFVPRSHLGLSINITQRNWTAVGSPECSAEPVIDPRGAVMPFRNRWSVDWWLSTGTSVLFPSRSGDVRQALLDGLPVVVTSCVFEGLRVEQTVYVSGRTLVMDVTVSNPGDAERACQIAVAIRPFNAEGTALLRQILFDRERNEFVMDGSERFTLSASPALVHCAGRNDGDPAMQFAREVSPRYEAVCDAGLASGFAAFPATLAPGGQFAVRGTATLEGAAEQPAELPSVVAGWKALLARGAQITTPDEGLNALLRSSLSTLLMFTDGDSITPGPWTYHQFWFRDAAMMMRALDVFGFHGQVGRIIRTFPQHQERSGYFRSQQGEWDSNGQVLWCAWQHAVISGDMGDVGQIMDALRSGVVWIRKSRQPARAVHGGLLPAGLSAEHLGLADYYFWDNWWSAAGLEAYARLCTMTGRMDEGSTVRALLHEYRAAIEEAIAGVRAARGIKEIPAGPARGPDCGMIGSCAPWYPLQEYGPEDIRMRSTLTRLGERYSFDGMFFQNFIHSGTNPYLTMQIAHAWLYAGEREKFWKTFIAVAKHASATLNFPEAIHPITGGGAMGDGHHGWAAAEIVLAMRGAFVEEIWTTGKAAPRIVLLGGIPAEWLSAGLRCAMRNAPVPGGVISVETDSREEGLQVAIDFDQHEGVEAEAWVLRLPVTPSRVTANGAAAPSVATSGGETTLMLPVRAGRTTVLFEGGINHRQTGTLFPTPSRSISDRPDPFRFSS